MKTKFAKKWERQYIFFMAILAMVFGGGLGYASVKFYQAGEYGVIVLAVLIFVAFIPFAVWMSRV